MNKQEIKAFGDYIVICVNDSLFMPRSNETNYIFNKTQDTPNDFIVGKVISVGSEIEGLYEGETVFIAASSELIELAYTKTGVVYAVSALDVVASLKEVD